MGATTLKNRVCMAALTRQRCNPLTCIPDDLALEYYSQRAGAGMILTEATAWSQRGKGFIGGACLYNQEQAEGWRKVNEAVHQKNGKVYIQLFHAGRVSHPKKTFGL